MASWNISDVASNLLFAQAPIAWTTAMEDDEFYKEITHASNRDVVKGGDGKYYVKGTAVVKNSYPTRGIAEGGSRPAYTAPTLALPTWDLWTNITPVQLSGLAIDAGQLISEISMENVAMQAAMRAAGHFFSQCLRGQHTGRICSATTAGSSSTTLIVDSTTPLRPGLTIDSYDASGVKEIDSATIVTIDSDTQVTLSKACTWTVGSRIVYEDCYNMFPYGLADIVQDNRNITCGDYTILHALDTYANISRSTYPTQWTATVYQPAGEGQMGAMQDWWINKLFTNMYNKLKHLPHVTHVFADPDTITALMQVVPVNERRPGETVVIGSDGVFVICPLVGTKYKVVPCRDFWKYSLWALNMDDIQIRWLKEPGWVKELDGSVLKMNINEANGTWTVTGSFMVTWNLIAHPYEHGLLAGIQPPSGA